MNAQPAPALCVSAVTVAHMASAAALASPVERRAELVATKLDSTLQSLFGPRLLPFTEAHAIAVARVTAAAHRAGYSLTDEEAAVAAVAIVNNLTVAALETAAFAAAGVRTLKPNVTD